MQVLDPGLEMEDVQKTFMAIGATDSLDKEQFWQWAMYLFGDLDDVQFVGQMAELLDVAAIQNEHRGSSGLLVPSSSPSDVPSSSPSDVPSSLPSDVPSSLPSDAHGVEGLQQQHGSVPGASAAAEQRAEEGAVVDEIVGVGELLERMNQLPHHTTSSDQPMVDIAAAEPHELAAEAEADPPDAISNNDDQSETSGKPAAEAEAAGAKAGVEQEPAEATIEAAQVLDEVTTKDAPEASRRAW